MAREIITLACAECDRRNYVTKRNKKAGSGRLQIKKFCKFDRKHTIHKETR